MTTEINSAHPDPKTDAKAVIDAIITGMPLDSEVARRVHERAEKAKKEILAAHGVQDIGVQIIRELRGELPEP